MMYLCFFKINVCFHVHICVYLCMHVQKYIDSCIQFIIFYIVNSIAVLGNYNSLFGVKKNVLFKKVICVQWNIYSIRYNQGSRVFENHMYFSSGYLLPDTFCRDSVSNLNFQLLNSEMLAIDQFSRRWLWGQ